MRHDEPPVTTTTFSTSPNAPRPLERRQQTRQLATLRVGKLIIGDEQQLCLIRNISSGGLMAHIYAPRAIGDHVTVELKSDHQVSGEVVWIRDSHIGIRFHETVDVGEVLANGSRARAPRLDIACRARLRIGAKVFTAEVHDVSQGGVKIQDDGNCTMGDEIVVTIEGLSMTKGVVRWCRDGWAGIAFNRPIAFDELTRWIGLRRGQAR